MSADQLLITRADLQRAREQTRAILRFAGDLERTIERLRVSRNGWRIIATVQALGYAVILANTYVFGGGA